MEVENIANKPSQSLIALLVLSLIPLILSLLKLVNNSYLFIGLFALDFLLVGIASTRVIHPQLSFKEVTRKIIMIIAFGLIFSLISTIARNYLKLNISSILLFLSLFVIIFSLVAYIRLRKAEQGHEIEEYDDKSIQRTIYVLAFFCVISYIGMEVPPFSVIPLWFGLCIPFIVLIPGYLLTNLVNPYIDEILIIERFGISVFASLVVTSIIGLILVQIEHMLNMRHVSLVIVVLTLVILLPLYLIRITNIQPSKRFVSPIVNKAFIGITIISLIAVIASGALVVTGNVDSGSNTGNIFQGNTTFNVSGIQANAGTDGYYNFSNDETINVTMDITNKEHKDMNYTVKIEITNDTTNKTVSEYPISLKNDESYSFTTNLTMSEGKKDIQFILYKDNQPYKIKHLHANVVNEEE